MSSQTRTFYSSISKGILSFFLGGVLFLIGLVMLHFKAPPIWIAWFILILGGLCSTMALSVLIFRYPRITLHPRGFEFITIFNKLSLLKTKISHQWSDVGQFSAGSFSSPKLGTQYFACAFSDEHHDLLASREDKTAPDFFNGDIKIPLHLFSFGKSIEDAQVFCDELNRWREYFGSPEITVSHPDAYKLYTQLKAKNMNASIKMILWATFGPLIILLATFVGQWLAK